MIKLFNDEEFKSAKCKEKLPLKCLLCNTVFYRTKSKIRTLEFGQKDYINRGSFCSQQCFIKTTTKKLKIKCINCNKEFEKKLCQIKKFPNHFCSQSCAATYNNTHKTKGTRVSKLEIWLQKQLTLLYPQLEIHYNRKDAINSELDIYIPRLKLAFELNGIFHYEPIYGEEKLKQTQNNDDRKLQACIENTIEMCLIDVSSFGYFKEDGAKKYLEIIQNIINKKMVASLGVEPNIT